MKTADLNNIIKKATMFFLMGLMIISFQAKAQESYNILALNKNRATEYPKSKLPSFEFAASNLNGELENISVDLLETHPFGELIAKKLSLLDKKYTSEEAISPGNPQTKTMIKKPIIYQATRRIERYLKKSVRKGTISTETATSELNKVLDVTLNILTADTQNFEKTLKSLKDDQSKIDLFTNRVTLLY